MTSLELPGDLFSFGGRVGKSRLRSALREQEQAVAQALPRPGQPEGLSSYVPSALISTEKRMLALLIGGAPAWSRRLKRIDTLIDEALRRIVAPLLEQGGYLPLLDDRVRTNVSYEHYRYYRTRLQQLLAGG